MDEIDYKILAILQKDGRKTYTEIARIAGVSPNTARNRISKLLKKQVIQIVGMIDPAQLGFDAPALIGVDVNPAQLEEAAITISSFPEVSYLIMVSGEYDLFVEVLCKDREHLAEFLSEKLWHVPGIQKTQTFLTLRTYKIAYGAKPSIDLSQALVNEDT